MTTFRLSRVKALSLWTLIATGLAVLAQAAWPAGGWLATGFDTLLPSDRSSPWQARADAAATAAFERQLVFLVAGEEAGQVEAFVQMLESQLRTGGYLEADVQDSEAERWRQLSQWLYPHRQGLLAHADREGLRQEPAEHLAQFRRLLYSPLGGSLTNSLPSDPAGLFRNYLEATNPLPAPVQDLADAAATRLLIYQLRASPDAVQAGSGLYQRYLSLQTEAAERGLSLYATGAPLYSAYGVYSAQREISTLGLLSLLMLVVLLAALLRSATAILLTLLGVCSGLLGGLVMTVVLQQQIHILTLVFGATIIGIAADYAFHFLAHTTVAGESRGRTLQRVLPGLATGLLTTVVAFTALTLLPFPGIRQIGIFMATGLVCSFLTVCLLFPALYPARAAVPVLPRFCYRARFQLPPGWAVLLLSLIAVIPGLASLHPSDDIRAFYAVPDKLEKDQAVIASVLGVVADSRYLLVLASDPEALLQTEERLRETASKRLEGGEPGPLSGISQLIPSQARQQQNYAVLRDVLEAGHFDRHLRALGFSASSAGTIQAQLSAPFQPLRLDALANHSLPLGIGGFLGCEAAVCGSWMRVTGPVPTAILESLAAEEAAVELIEPVAAINRMLSSYRGAVLGVLALGATMITLLLLLLCGWRRAVQILVLPFMACLLSLSAIGFLVGSYSIINLLALLLIVGVGLDYAIFRAFTSATEQPATSLAITLSALTSIFAFGMLAFSGTPLIASFGQTIAFGLAFAYLLSWFRVEKAS